MVSNNYSKKQKPIINDTDIHQSTELLKKLEADVYFVDDESLIIEIASIALETANIRVKTFQNPKSALDSFSNENTKPSVLITDYVMKPLNGIELIKECKRIQPNLKTILISGNVGPEIMNQTDIKPERFISKPFKSNTLIETVYELMKNK